MAENIRPAGNSILTRLLKYWLPVIVMIAAMYSFSTDVFSGENTRGVIDKLVQWLFSGASHRTISRANYVVRKLSHFVEYAFLAALLFRAFRADSPLLWRWSWAAYSFAIVVCWAILDEFHQTLTTKRSGSVYDVLLDCSGGLFMLLVIAAFNYRKLRKKSGAG